MNFRSPTKREPFSDLVARVTQSQAEHCALSYSDKYQSREIQNIHDKKPIELIKSAIADSLESYLPEESLENATSDVLREIQNVIGGESHYIPRCEMNNAVRDKEIFMERASGVTLSKIAIKHHLSTSRILQICRKLQEASGGGGPQQ